MRDTKVLAVDNSPVLLKIISSILEETGCVLRTATDGMDALDVMEEFRPDIIFTDLVMPRIDGAKLAYIIRNTPELKDIFLVILTGIAMEDDTNLHDLDADLCIAKGPAATMKENILQALEMFNRGERGRTGVMGKQGLHPREVTRELLTGKRHNEVILDAMTEGVVELDSQGRVVMVNSAAMRLFELPEERLLGFMFTDLLEPQVADMIREWMEDLATSGDFLPLIFDYGAPLRINGRQVMLNLVPVPEDREIFYIGILQDVSRRKEIEQRQRQLEKELQRIRKLDAMSMMASGISHDFNNLLTIINGNIEMARVHTSEERVAHLLEESAKALQLTCGLIRQFTTFSENYLPSKSRVELKALIEQVLVRELEGSAIGYAIETDDPALVVDLDSELMQQVFHNIIQNSREAMAGKGSISVRIDRVDGEKEAENIDQPIPPGEFVRIRISDTGPGIDPDIIDQVFDPYFSTKQKGAQKGMGLGLTIVHAIVKKHGGFVWIRSGPGDGCTIILYLACGSWTEQLLDGAGIKKPRRVLIMDDDEMMRMISGKMFETFGCEVEVAENGETALELYHGADADGRGFNLVLLDLRIDSGMNGTEVARELKALAPDLPLVAISGDFADEVMVNYTEYGFSAAVAKPFSLDVVEDLVRRYLV
ncbi:MAG TPA: response regulator [Desulfobulbus sp.]|nr:response regulator [Desulfobulbus sp.]